MTQMTLPDPTGESARETTPAEDRPLTLETVSQVMQQRFAAVPRLNRGQTSIQLPGVNLVDAAQVLRDTFGFEMLMDITAVDYWPDVENRFHVIYQLYSLQHNFRLTLRVSIDGRDPRLATLEKLYPSANWYEREVWDMFGIRFTGHSDPRRILMPSDWSGHPLRKDYPLGYEEVQYTFNRDEIQRHKPSPGK
jgi:NADH-quinone oxidoreductase subunit C